MAGFRHSRIAIFTPPIEKSATLAAGKRLQKLRLAINCLVH
jgi:hypothetical protein